MEKLNGTPSSDKVQKSEGEQPAPGSPESTVSQSRQPGLGSPLPRPKRRRKRSKADRGLPDDTELARLAAAYLEKQRKHWPKLVEEGLLPVPSPEVIHHMVDDFKERHRGTAASPDSLQQLKMRCAKQAGAYLRFSCDNSNPTSILDQMTKALDKARDEERFIPWEYVYADFSVTGLDASRQGYSSYKQVLQDKSHWIETTFIDDFTRASRDELEWWKLAALSKRLNKRMIGASDGFDLHRSDWDVQVTLYGLVSRLFLKGLREKVRRGMGGASDRGTCLGKLPLGLTRRQKIDDAGNLMVGADQLPVYEPVIDPQTSPDRLQIFQLFVGQKWTAFKIARSFNDRKVDGWDRWSESNIKNLLWSPTAIGVFIWNKTRREYDWEEEKWVKVRNPRSQWKVMFRPELAIVPLELWRAARRKLAAMRRASPRTGKKPSRNENRATTLFSGTLLCNDCGEELKLIRSAAEYKQMGCLNGVMHSSDCQFRASKSVRVIEECLLGYLRNQLLTESVVEELVVRVNRLIEEQALQPCTDTGPQKAQVKQLRTKIERLVKKVAETDDDRLSTAYHQQILQYQREHNSLLATIREEEARQRSSARPIDIDAAKAYLTDLRETLDQDIPVAAETIRALTGPIRVRQELLPGRNRSRWVASFQPNLQELLRRVSPPETQIDDATSKAVSESTTVEVVIDKLPKYELLAAEFQKLQQCGASKTALASAFGLSPKVVTQTLEFAKTGERPTALPAKKKSSDGQNSKATRYKDIAPRVAELRDVQMKHIDWIAEHLGVSEGTVRRAYDYAHPEAVRKAVAEKAAVKRGRFTHLDHTIFEKIRELSDQGQSPKEIADVVGCGVSTVRREILRLEAERRDDRTTQTAAKSA